METLLQDVRYGWRMLWKNPGFTAVAVLTLALGIGACTAIFSVTDTILLRPLPYFQPERLVTVTETLPKMGTDVIGVAAGEYQDYRSQNRSFSEVAAFQSAGFNLTGEGQPVRVNAARISASAFPLLQVSPELGRTFTEQEDRNSAERVVVLSHQLWQHNYGSDPTIFLAKQCGWMNSLIRSSALCQLRFVFRLTALLLQRWRTCGCRWYSIQRCCSLQNIARREFGVGLIARLKSDVYSGAGATGCRDKRPPRFSCSNMDTRARSRLRPRFIRLRVISRRRPVLWCGYLALAVGCVFLIACANVANLLLARASQRHREVAVRVAIGANRWRVLRQCLVESALLALAGAAAGVGVAQAFVLGLQLFGPADVPRLHDVSLHPLALLFTLAVSLISAIGFGFAPAWRLSKTAPIDALRDSRQAGPARGTQKLQHSVAVFEMAAAVVLLVSGGLLLKSFGRLLKSPTGFDPHGVFVVRTIFDLGRYPDPAKRMAVQKQLLDGLAQIPGVITVAAASHLPLSDVRQIGFRLEHAAGNDYHWAQNSLVSPGYFRAMGISLLQGRDFNQQDLPQSSPVAIVSETFAKEYFPGQNAVGQRFQWGDREFFTIVGIAADVRISALDADPPPMIYDSMFQVQSGASSQTAFELRITNTQGLVAAVQQKVWAVDKDLPLYRSTTLANLVSESVAQKRFAALLLGSFALIALFLAAIGLFGVISYLVAERTREFGVRLALGANRANIYTHVLKYAAGMGIAGCVLGLLVSLLVSRTLQANLYQVSRFDLSTFALVPVILIAVALFAAYWPARRATKVDPMVALRYE